MLVHFNHANPCTTPTVHLPSRHKQSCWDQASTTCHHVLSAFNITHALITMQPKACPCPNNSLSPHHNIWRCSALAIRMQPASAQCHQSAYQRLVVPSPSAGCLLDKVFGWTNSASKVLMHQNITYPSCHDCPSRIVASACVRPTKAPDAACCLLRRCYISTSPMAPTFLLCLTPTSSSDGILGLVPGGHPLMAY